MKIYLVQLYVNHCWLTDTVWKVKEQAEIVVENKEGMGWKARIKETELLEVAQDENVSG